MIKDKYLYIEDIKNAIDWILNDYVFGVDYYEFINDNKTLDAVIRQLEIIGEAMNQLPKDFLENNKGLPVKEATAMRNVLIHEYNTVDAEKVWNTVQEDLPVLRKVVEDILKARSNNK